MPACMNPAHLVKGSQADNIKDRDTRGRTARGEAHGHAKLTEADVRLIRASNKLSTTLALELGVSLPAVDKARRRTTWRHVDDRATNSGGNVQGAQSL